MSARHTAWPYPRNKKQVIQTVMVTLAVVFAGLVTTAMWAEHYRDKVLDADALQQAAVSLSGYASEGSVEAGQAAHGRSTQHYQRAYLQQLATETRQVTDFLQSHPAHGPLDHSRNAILRSGADLQRRLEATADMSRPDQLTQAQNGLRSLQNGLTAIGEAL